MRRLITWEMKEFPGIITWETKVTIIEMQVGMTQGKDSVVVQQTENWETSRTRIGTEMIRVVCI